MVSTVERWQATPKLAFVDAYLSVLADLHKIPVFTKNVQELVKQGAVVPDPLPH